MTEAQFCTYCGEPIIKKDTEKHKSGKKAGNNKNIIITTCIAAFLFIIILISVFISNISKKIGFVWVVKKENAIKEAAKQWEGDSGEPMARNMTAIEYTEERCYYLTSLIN